MTLKTILAALFLTLAAPAFAGSGNADNGKKKSEPCKACHGETGISPAPDFPKIAGQHEEYLTVVLTHYKNGKRKNAIMQGQVANLSLRDMQDLAAYFANQKGLEVKY